MLNSRNFSTLSLLCLGNIFHSLNTHDTGGLITVPTTSVNVFFARCFCSHCHTFCTVSKNGWEHDHRSYTCWNAVLCDDFFGDVPDKTTTFFIHFLECKVACILILIALKFASHGLIDNNLASIKVYSLTPNGWQAIAWTNVDQNAWSFRMSLVPMSKNNVCVRVKTFIRFSINW